MAKKKSAKKKSATKKAAKKATKKAAAKPAKKAAKKSAPKAAKVVKKAKKKARRTTMNSSKGKKLYAVRDAEGQFKDIQTYSSAHGQDIKRDSDAETQADAKANAGQ